MSNYQPVSTSFKPGQSGNPGGRPKKAWTFSGLLEQALEEEDEKGIPHKVTITRKLVEMAKKGDLGAQKEIINRLDGLPQQHIDHTTGGEKFTNNIDAVIGLSNTSTKTTDGSSDPL